MAYARSPTGSPIVGTLEILSGRAEITDGSFKRKGSGIDFKWAGDTEIFYDDQETVERLGKDGKSHRVFLDEDGMEWTEDQIILFDTDPDQDDDEGEDQGGSQ